MATGERLPDLAEFNPTTDLDFSHGVTLEMYRAWNELHRRPATQDPIYNHAAGNPKDRHTIEQDWADVVNVVRRYDESFPGLRQELGMMQDAG